MKIHWWNVENLYVYANYIIKMLISALELLPLSKKSAPLQGSANTLNQS